MGKQALIIVVALSIGFFLIGGAMHDKENRTVSNYVAYYEKLGARNASNAAVQLAMRRIADSTQWRAGYRGLSMLGGTVDLTVRDTTYDGKKAMKIGTLATFGGEKHTDTVVFKLAGGFIPPAVRAAFTAFGPLDKSLSDMFVDGRDHDTNNAYVPDSGLYGVSTGAASFVNLEPANIGGTDRTLSPYQDIVPAYPEDPRVVETSSYWKNLEKRVPADPRRGARDPRRNAREGREDRHRRQPVHHGPQGPITDLKDLNKAPVQGITYVHVPNGTSAGITLPANPSGILIIHSDAVDAYATGLKVANGAPFRGLIIIDKVFHIHMDILGAIVELTQNTVMDKECNGNRDHWINYSSQEVKKATAWLGGGGSDKGGWRGKFVILSWME